MRYLFAVATLLLLGADRPMESWLTSEIDDGWLLAVPRTKCVAGGGDMDCFFNPKNFPMVGITDAPPGCSYRLVAKTIWLRPKDKKKLRLLAAARKPMASSTQEIAHTFGDKGDVKRLAFTRRPDADRFLVEKGDALSEFFIVWEDPSWAAFWTVFIHESDPASCRTKEFNRELFERIGMSISREQPKLPLLKAPEPPADRNSDVMNGRGMPTGGVPKTADGPVDKKKAARAKKARTSADERKAAGALVSQGLEILKSGSVYIAEQKADAALDADPGSRDALALHALTMRLSGDAGKESADLKEAGHPGKDLRPDLDHLFGAGNSLAAGLAADWSGKYTDAAGYYNAAALADREAWLPLALRGIARLEMQDCAGARVDLRDATRKNPNFGMYTFQRYQGNCGREAAPVSSSPAPETDSTSTNP